MESPGTSSQSESRAVKYGVYGVSLFVCLAVAVVLYAWPGRQSSEGPSLLASVNASLNGAAGICLIVGFSYIRRGNRALHERWMKAALTISACFLLTYLAHHIQVGSVPYQGVGLARTVYFSLLIPHIILAAVIVPLVLFTFLRAQRGDFPAHRRIARYTFPLWLFVSLSGVILYFMLYQGQLL